MKKINKNGFTLIEILAVIVIMGILSGLGIVSVKAILNKANEKYYDSQKKSMLMATKSYVQDNRNSLPKSIGETKIIYLYNLQKKKYIGEVLDRHNKSCSSDKTEDDSYVKITKTSKTEYSYYVYLACYDVDSSVSRDVTVTVLQVAGNLPKAKITVTCEGNDNAVASYSYSIYKGNKLIKDSGNIAVKGNKLSYEKDISLEGYEPGSYRIVVTAYDKLGNKGTGENTIKVENGELKCQILSPNVDAWSKGPITVTAKCSNDKNFECEREVYTQTFTEDGINGIIQMKDIYSGSKECSVSIMIDKTPPSKPIVNNPNDGKWAKAEYTIDLTSKDDTSGIASFQYSYNRDAVGTSTSASDNTTKWIIYDNLDGEAGKNITFTTRPFTADRNQPVYFRACDNAGNCSEIASTTIMIDKTPPSKPIVNNPNDGKWAKANYTIDLTSKDDTSGIASFQYSYNRDAVGTSTSASDNTTKWIIYDNSSGEAGKNITFTTRPFTAERNQPVYFRACDNAGNCSEIASTTIMLDKTAPTCSFSAGNTTWKKGSHSITATCSDSLSGCTSDTASHKFTKSSGTVKTSTISYTISDNAGNSATCKETGNFYIDNNPPTTPIGGSVSISNVSGSIVKPESTDSGSGIKEYRYYVTTSSDYPDKNDFTRTSKTFTGSCGKKYYVFSIAIDNVDNRSAVHKIGNVTASSCDATPDAGDTCSYYGPAVHDLGYNYQCTCGDTHGRAHYIYCRSTDKNGKRTYTRKTSSPTLICPNAPAKKIEGYYLIQDPNFNG